MKDNLDIQLLRTFATVASTQSLTETAKKLHLTQPAVSQQLKRLEALLDLTLFTPHSRRRTLTASGTRLLEHAQSLLSVHDRIWTDIHNHDLQGGVTLGVPDLYATYLLPDILAKFNRTFPGISINLRCALSMTLLEELNRGEIDLALITRMPHIEKGEFIRSEDLVWITNPNLDAHNTQPLPLAMLPPGNYYRDLALDALQSAGIPWTETTHSESIAGLHAAVLAGLAVTVLPRSTLTGNMKSLNEAVNLPPLPKIELVLQHREDLRSPTAERLASFISENLAAEQPHFK